MQPPSERCKECDWYVEGKPCKPYGWSKDMIKWMCPVLRNEKEEEENDGD